MSSRLNYVRVAVTGCMLTALLVPGDSVAAQRGPNLQKSANMKLVAHIPLAGALPTDPGKGGDIAGLGRRTFRHRDRAGAVAAVRVRLTPLRDRPASTSSAFKDPKQARRCSTPGGSRTRAAPGRGRAQPDVLQDQGPLLPDASPFQFQQGGPDADLGAIVFDVTGLPDTTQDQGSRPDPGAGGCPAVPRDRSRTSTRRAGAAVHDQRAAVRATSTTWTSSWRAMPATAWSGRVPVPEGATRRSRVQRAGYHDFYVGYDPGPSRTSSTAPARGGYYVFDVTDVAEPEAAHLDHRYRRVSVRGHTFTPTPIGRYAVAETEYQYAPLRIFDLKPGLDGTGEDHLAPDRRLDRRLEEPAAQPRGPLAVRLRLGATRTACRSST